MNDHENNVTVLVIILTENPLRDEHSVHIVNTDRR